MTDAAVIDAIRHASHGDPFAVLGVHADAQGRRWLRAFLPGAAQVEARSADAAQTLSSLALRHGDGFFEGAFPAGAADDYRLHVQWHDGNRSVLDDPYRFPPVLGDMDVWLMGEGTHLRPYEVLGATRRDLLGVAGTSFAVWAPNASRVSVVGDFNLWDGRRHPMRLRRECGVWEIFLPGVDIGARYKYEIRTPRRPRAAAEGRPLRAAVRAAPGHRQRGGAHARGDPALRATPARQRARCADQHLRGAPGSWRRKPDEGNRWLNWDELADTLVPYAREMGFTHLELLPVSGAPLRRLLGLPADRPVRADLALRRPRGIPPLRRPLPRRRHRPDPRLGAGAFPDRCARPGRFDGTHLYEYADPREGFHQDWNTLIYNFGRTEVRNFLVGNALYWLERYGVDGLRVDAVASMLYRDYSRKHGEWMPNVHGGRENLEAIAFLKRMNEVVGSERPQAVTLAEESTAFPAVSRPTFAGGLGFHYKWNMGWMHDTLQYIERDPVHRKHHHGEITFGAGLRVQRELRAADLARRGGARQGLDARQDAGRRLAEVRQPARLLRLHVGPPGQEAALHGLRVRAGRRVEPRPEPGLAPARDPRPRRRAAAAAGPQRPVQAHAGAVPARLRRRRLRVDRPRRCRALGAELRSPRPVAGLAGAGGLQLHAVGAPWLPHRRAAAPASTASASTPTRRTTAAATSARPSARSQRRRCRRTAAPCSIELALPPLAVVFFEWNA